MLIHSIEMKNFLGFGNDTKRLSPKPLNMLIGPNGSGKSNVLEAIELLRSAEIRSSIPN